MGELLKEIGKAVQVGFACRVSELHRRTAQKCMLAQLYAVMEGDDKAADLYARLWNQESEKAKLWQWRAERAAA